MTFAALDSDLLGPLFAAEAMRAVFSDRARLAAMLRAEAALARAEAQFGLVPEALAAAIEAIPAEVSTSAAGSRDQRACHSPGLCREMAPSAANAVQRKVRLRSAG